MNKLIQNGRDNYVHPFVNVISLNVEALLCVSAGTDEFIEDDSWSEIFGEQL